MNVQKIAAATVLLGCLASSVSVRAQTAATATTDTETAKTQLRAKIKEAETFAENQYSLASWNDLRAATYAARQVADKAGATSGDLQTALDSVQQKIAALQERAVVADLNPRIALGASLFATQRSGPVNNVALKWATADAADGFELYRSTTETGHHVKIYSGKGTSFNDYNLSDSGWGQDGYSTYSYELVAHSGDKTLHSNVEQITMMAMPTGLGEYSNQTGLGASLGEPEKIDGKYYEFSSKREGKTVVYSVKSSPDRKNWTDESVVLDASSHPDLDDYKLESGSRFYDEVHKQFVWWVHWERSDGYGAGRVMVATAKPGERFKVHHIYNPLGIQVRDMSVFKDDDGQGYLVAASNVPGQAANETNYIFKLNADYTDVTGIVTKINEGRHREAPSILKANGYYYLFSSQTAGWYPSQAGYNSAKSLAGPWSDLRPIGNTSTFSSQSGWIMDYGKDGRHVNAMMSYRWVHGEGTSGSVIIPFRAVDGFVMGDYSPNLLVSQAKETILPLHAGQLLSQNQPATATIAGAKDGDISKAFDGDYYTAFVGAQKKWPFSVTTDLGAPSQVRNVQISWFIHRGSEAYYKYTIEGSLDGKTWTTLLDRTDDKDTTISKTYGFSSDMLPTAPTARYVRINVRNAVLHNNPKNNWYTPTLYEIKVYGDRK